MRSSVIGRYIAFAVIFTFVAWTAVRALTARPPAIPATPFPKPAIDAPLAQHKSQETAVLAGGCFWGVQAIFQHLKGVTSVTSGYSGGHVKSPGYELVSLGVTGHAESVNIHYDGSKISYGQLLMVYFAVAHDPTQLNRQGPDSGSQYRSAIFYLNPEQKRIAEAYISQLTDARVYSRPIVTKVASYKAFYAAENYHQDYLKHHPKNPYIVINDMPKLQRLQKDFPDLYRDY
ncbi:MAG TPA: peptide-methionine (S)-S-oxide reductase MsrA [Candidatus Dormibacteraeota bacterium]|nr:peptide-methionine (S)-S-oxide reductase MsrA [Candidatus Dormibacteraeota bacterium]